MKRDEDAVRRTPDINLHEIDAEIYSFPDGRQGVFRSMSRRSSMTDLQYAAYAAHGII
jgi:hypothetical protein